MLWLCASLPDFPLEICSRAAPADEPLAVSEGKASSALLPPMNARAAPVCGGERVSAKRMR
jgi:hypothetical protein